MKLSRKTPKSDRKWKALTLHDSPTENTGFAGVMKPLLPRWQASGRFERIDVWGINYQGWPHSLPWRIYPGGISQWNSIDNFKNLLNLIAAEKYTHLFILQDPWMLCAHGLPSRLRQQCSATNTKIIYYFPCDAPFKPEWLPIFEAADVCVAYTQYGVTHTRAAGYKHDVHVIPHGVDTNVFHPLKGGPFGPVLGKFAVGPEDLFILNVNRNEKRKGLVNSLQILVELHRLCVPAKLMLHAPRLNQIEQFDLEYLAAQLGLAPEHWAHNDAAFRFGIGQAPESYLNQLYNAAHLVLSTSYGEGWGLSITEGAAAGCKVGVPDHTSCGEIADQVTALGDNRIFKLSLSSTAIANPFDAGRIRYPVDVRLAADLIHAQWVAGFYQQPRVPLPPAVKEWLSWDRIAAQWLTLF